MRVVHNTIDKQSAIVVTSSDIDIKLVITVSSIVLRFLVSQGWLRRNKKVYLPVYLTEMDKLNKYYLSTVYTQDTIIMGYSNSDNQWIDELTVYVKDEDKAKEKLQDILINKGWMI